MSLTDDKKSNGSSSDTHYAVDKKLLNPRAFAALCRLQAEIAHETGWQPSLSKLASALVNPDTLAYLKEIMLVEFKNRTANPTEEKITKPADKDALSDV